MSIDTPAKPAHNCHRDPGSKHMTPSTPNLGELGSPEMLEWLDTRIAEGNQVEDLLCPRRESNRNLRDLGYILNQVLDMSETAAREELLNVLKKHMELELGQANT